MDVFAKNNALKKRALFKVFSVFFAVALCCTSLQSDASSQLTQIKAGYLFNFLKFISWNENNPGSVLVIGILGNDPFNGLLQKAVRGQKVGGSEVRVLHFPEASDVSLPVHLLFVQTLDETKIELAKTRLKGFSTLYVGDHKSCVQEEYTFCFKTKANRLSFDINLSSVPKDQVYVNGRLLSLADNVIQ